MKPGLSLRVSQQLSLTPQLQQAIRLMQLSTLELSAEAERMLDENPFLERDDERADREEFGLDAADAGVSEGDLVSERAQDLEADDDAPAASSGDLAEDGWEGDGSAGLAPDDSEWGGEAPARLAGGGPDDDEATDPAGRVAAPETLAEHLLAQTLALRLSPQDMAALRFLIESLDEDGYLHDSLAQLAATLTGEGDDTEQLEELAHRFTLALRLLQSFEPAGVGAHDLTECLMLQLKAMLAETGGDAARRQAVNTALVICALPDALPLLAKRDARRLAKASGATAEQTRAAMQLIARMEPKPGRRFAGVERNIIVPDVIVSLSGAPGQPRLRVRLNADNVPRLRVQQTYARALRGWRGDNREAVAQQVQEARWFVKSIQQRYDTILRVARAIAQRQRSFFIHGELAMRPMVQRELAEELGVHESTISRVTTAKYMATPRGTFELKYFFGSALGTDAGGNTSSTAVRALIRQLIAAESPARPLSDLKLSGLLKEEGIDCARRTVAKYREAMRIPVASLRKK
ncbi:MAG: RNA polymerase factor sigma-54 [Burkholderiaceae bacterium]|jgi:RNA polymerase sigma-54 factor|nr:RNA polymerase factor sigma-54 [Burkholderiaceae bacterium]